MNELLFIVNPIYQYVCVCPSLSLCITPPPPGTTRAQMSTPQEGFTYQCKAGGGVITRGPLIHFGETVTIWVTVYICFRGQQRTNFSHVDVQRCPLVPISKGTILYSLIRMLSPSHGVHLRFHVLATRHKEPPSIHSEGPPICFGVSSMAG